jgi:hypothetical protein
MNANEEKSVEQLARLLSLMEPSREEILARHGALIDRWLAESSGEPAPVRTLVELCRGFRVRLAEGMKEVEAGLSSLSLGAEITTFSAPPRGVDAPPPTRAPVSAGGFPSAFSCLGVGCSGRVSIRPQADGRLTIELSLQDEQGRAIRPFFLTVQQQDTVMLDQKRIDADRYHLENIASADLRFVLADETGQRHVSMGWEQACEGGT